jgi:hypothetical protein
MVNDADGVLEGCLVVVLVGEALETIDAVLVGLALVG